MRYLDLAELTSPPGTAFNYFNPNYNVLALVVAEVIGVKLEDYLVENVFEPLEMTRSFTELEPARQAGLAEGHIFFFGFPLTCEQPFYPAELPAGFMISTQEKDGYQLIRHNGAVEAFYSEVLLLPDQELDTTLPMPSSRSGSPLGPLPMDWWMPCWATSLPWGCRSAWSTVFSRSS